MNSSQKTGHGPSRTEHLTTQADGVARRVGLHELMGQDKVLEIEFQGQIYRLQVTRQGKLILTK